MNGNRGRKSVRDNAERQHAVIEERDLDEPAAQSMDARELYVIRTQSNELIWIVDARSEEEYERMHISGAYSLVPFLALCDG